MDYLGFSQMLIIIQNPKSMDPKILNLIFLEPNFPKDISGYDNFLKKM
jgi:uncharacterized protein YozE (UPF0346 family)